MRVLLDTHVWLWMLTEPEKLGAARPVIEDTANDLLLSAASSWEIAIKHGLGRLPLPLPPAVYIPRRISESGVTPLAIEHAHAAAVADLPPHHRDPFDRILVVQSELEDAPLVTADGELAHYDVRLIKAGPTSS